MAEKRNPSARRAAGASGRRFAGQRNGQKHSNVWNNFQQPLGSVCVYDGLAFVGAVVPQAGRWLAVRPDGRRIGTFDLRHRAEHALYQAAGPGGAHG